jgi:hypothetical protein
MCSTQVVLIHKYLYLQTQIDLLFKLRHRCATNERFFRYICSLAESIPWNRFLGSLNGYKLVSENATKIIKPSSYTNLVIWVQISVLWTTNGLCHQTRLFCFCFIDLTLPKCIQNNHHRKINFSIRTPNELLKNSPYNLLHSKIFRRQKIS